jgi:hypothetical protein
MGFLTKLPAKAEAFAADIYFREPWSELLGRWPLPALPAQLWDLAGLILKPEAMMTGNALLGLELIRDMGGDIIFVAPVTFTRRSIRDEWRYQINKATTERIAAMDLVLQGADALYVLMRRPPAATWPAVLEVAAMKGPSDPATRSVDHLRRRIGGVQDPLVNFIHSPDEPADLIRQWGVLFPAKVRQDIYQAMERPCGSHLESARRLATQLIQRAPRNMFDLAASLDRVQAELSRRASGASRREAEALIDALRAGARGNWPDLRRRADQAGACVAAMDEMTIASLTPVMHLPGVSALLDGDVFDRWLTDGEVRARPRSQEPTEIARSRRKAGLASARTSATEEE